MTNGKYDVLDGRPKTKAEVMADLMDEHEVKLAKITKVKVIVVAQAAQWLRDDPKKQFRDDPNVTNIASMFHWANAKYGGIFWSEVDAYFMKLSGPNYLQRGN